MTPAWLRDLGGADAYQLLGAAPAATSAEIVRAHRRRIRELHPDRATGDAEQARLVNLARDILLDPVRRADYDRFLRQPAGPEPPPSTWDAEDSAWDAEDVVVGAEPTPAPPSAWETEDVTVGAAPPEPPPDRADLPDDWTSRPEEPGYYRSHPAYPARQASPGLAFAALVCALTCTPVGLILGLVHLRQHRRWGGRGEGMATAAVTISAIGIALICICYGVALLSALQSEATGG